MRVLLLDTFGKQVARMEVDSSEPLHELAHEGVVYRRIGVEDHETILRAMCQTCESYVGHQPDCYELQHQGAN